LIRVLEWVERHRHGPAGAAVTAGGALFGIAWTILEASGTSGSWSTIQWLLVLCVAASVATYILLLHRRLARLLRTHPDHAVLDVREPLEKILSRMEPPVADQIRAGLRQYEEAIAELREQLRPLTFPLEPVLVQSGSGTIGANGYAPDEAPPHEVEIDSFLIDPFPVTNHQFAEFLASPGNEEWSSDAFYSRYGIPYFLCEFVDGRYPPHKWANPVVWVNWFAAVAFCIWRSRQEGLQPVYEFQGKAVLADFSKRGWRLPTEAEWERVAREALKDGQLISPLMNPSIANYDRHYRGTTSAGTFRAVGSVYDLIGNVKEWCHDWYDSSYYPKCPPKNPRGPEDDTGFRAFRGGSWMEPLAALRVTRRGKLPPQNTNPDLGFRCVRRP